MLKVDVWESQKISEVEAVESSRTAEAACGGAAAAVTCVQIPPLVAPRRRVAAMRIIYWSAVLT